MESTKDLSDSRTEQLKVCVFATRSTVSPHPRQQHSPVLAISTAPPWPYAMPGSHASARVPRPADAPHPRVRVPPSHRAHARVADRARLLDADLHCEADVSSEDEAEVPARDPRGDWTTDWLNRRLLRNNKLSEVVQKASCADRLGYYEQSSRKQGERMHGTSPLSCSTVSLYACVSVVGSCVCCLACWLLRVLSSKTGAFLLAALCGVVLLVPCRANPVPP